MILIKSKKKAPNLFLSFSTFLFHFKNLKSKINLLKSTLPKKKIILLFIVYCIY
jgi:hypothetical protein